MFLYNNFIFVCIFQIDKFQIDKFQINKFHSVLI